MEILQYEVKRYNFKANRNKAYRLLALIICSIIVFSFVFNKSGVYAVNISQTEEKTFVDVQSSKYFIDKIVYDGEEVYLNIFDEKYTNLSTNPSFSVMYYDGTLREIEPIYFGRGFYIFKIKVPKNFVAMKLIVDGKEENAVVKVSQRKEIGQYKEDFKEQHISFLTTKKDLINQENKKLKNQIESNKKEIEKINLSIKEKEQMKSFSSSKEKEEIKKNIDKSYSDIKSIERSIERTNEDINNNVEKLKAIDLEIEFIRTGKIKSEIENNKTSKEKENKTPTINTTNEKNVEEKAEQKENNSTNSTGESTTNSQIVETKPTENQTTNTAEKEKENQNNRATTRTNSTQPNANLTTKPVTKPTTKPQNIPVIITP